MSWEAVTPSQVDNQPDKFALLGLQGKQFPRNVVPAHPTLLIRVDLGTAGVPVRTCHCWWLSIISFLFFQASTALNERLGLSATRSQTQNILMSNQLSWLCVTSCNITWLKEKGLGIQFRVKLAGRKISISKQIRHETEPLHRAELQLTPPRRLQPPLAPRTLCCPNKYFSRAF